MKSVEALKTESVAGHHLPNFEELDAKIANAWKNIPAASGFRKKAFIEEQKTQNGNRFYGGRHIAFMIYDYFRATGTGESILDFSDRMDVTLRGENVQGFDSK